jgi:hypothetical protein
VGCVINDDLLSVTQFVSFAGPSTLIGCFNTMKRQLKCIILRSDERIQDFASVSPNIRSCSSCTINIL